MTATVPARGSSPNPDPREYVGEEMTLFEHLNELRSRLFKSALAIALGFVIGFFFREQVLDLLREPYCDLPASLRAGADALTPDQCNLIVLRVLDSFFISVKAAAIVAVVVAAPVVCYQIWRFVTPGLRPIERRYSIPFIVISQVLFAGGAVFAYLLIPKALEFLLGFAGEGILPLLDANQYITFMLHTMIGFGVAFELPLVLIMLTLMGVVGQEGLRKYRRHALFGIFVAAAIITPTQDPVTMTLMALPLAALYEVAVVFARLHEKRQAAAEATG